MTNRKPQTGSIYRLPLYEMVIIDDVRTIKSSDGDYDVVDWISFSMSNTRGSIRIDSYYRDVPCGCTYNDTYGDNSNPHDPDCKVCNGTAVTSFEHFGFDKAEFIANNCKEYIMKTLTKPFNF